MTGLLFEDLPEFPVPGADALPADEQRLLDMLPFYLPDECVQEIGQQDEAACRRLEKRGLVKVHRWKTDPIAIRPTMYAGRIDAASPPPEETAKEAA